MSAAHCARSGKIIGISFRLSFNMKVFCVYSFELPHRGDSNEYTQHTIFNIKTENQPKLIQICSYGIFPKGLKNELETVVGNEPPGLEPLKFYCMSCIL